MAWCFFAFEFDISYLIFSPIFLELNLFEAFSKFD